jgi:hypothetical protein
MAAAAKRKLVSIPDSSTSPKLEPVVDPPSEGDIASVVTAQKRTPKPASPPPREVLDMSQIEQLELTQPKEVIEELITTPGLWLVIGAQKAGKTILSVQAALDYHAGSAFLGHYRMLESRSAFVIEQDDPAGITSVQKILKAYRGLRHPKKFHAPKKPDFILGEGFIEWLENEIRHRDVGLVVLDSYTAMRARRQHGGDIVKEESDDFTLLNALAKRAGCLILVLHHPSKTSAALDWDQQSAGTFAIGAAVDGLLRISRFRDLAINAPERLLQVRGRHIAGEEMVLRFVKDTLSYELVMHGSASALYPEIQILERNFRGRMFAPKDVVNETGMSRSMVHRILDRLVFSNVLDRPFHGQYQFR